MDRMNRKCRCIRCRKKSGSKKCFKGTFLRNRLDLKPKSDKNPLLALDFYSDIQVVFPGDFGSARGFITTGFHGTLMMNIHWIYRL